MFCITHIIIFKPVKFVQIVTLQGKITQVCLFMGLLFDSTSDRKNAIASWQKLHDGILLHGADHSSTVQFGNSICQYRNKMIFPIIQGVSAPS